MLCITVIFVGFLYEEWRPSVYMGHHVKEENINKRSTNNFEQKRMNMMMTKRIFEDDMTRSIVQVVDVSVFKKDNKRKKILFFEYACLRITIVVYNVCTAKFNCYVYVTMVHEMISCNFILLHSALCKEAVFWPCEEWGWSD